MLRSSVPTNVNLETGIAYGYISANSLHPDIVNELQMNGTDVYYADAVKEAQREFASDKEAQAEAAEYCGTGNWEEMGEDQRYEYTLEYLRGCWSGSMWEQQFNDSYQPDEPIHEGEKDGVTYRTSWLGGALHVFIANSPYITETARECSLCVPNAGNLDQVGEGHYQCYDVPPEWRREDD